jgi:hypothetical protein
MSHFVSRFAAGLLLAALIWPAAGAELMFDFAKCAPGEIPPGFRSALTGRGRPGLWRIMLEEEPSLLAPADAPALIVTKKAVLAQLDRDPTDERFPLLIYEKETFDDFILTTRFKTVAGEVEQMAGVAFRIQDETNYYVVRASSLGRTFRFYKFVNGERSTPIGPEVEIPTGVWHELRIECKANQINCSLNGKQMFPTAIDNTFAAGRIGYWTKSDSVSYFADTRITYTPRERPAQALVRAILDKYPRLLGLRIYAARERGEIVKVIASSKTSDIGEPGGTVERDVLARDTMYYGKQGKAVLVTLPMHDHNGEPMAAVRVVMRSFPGQTEQNAVARALPILRQMEARIRTPKELFE